MNAVVARTRALAAALLCLLVVDAAVHLGAADRAQELPSFPGFGLELPTAIRLAHGDAEVHLERVEGKWMVTAPFSGRADDDRVDALLGPLGRGLAPDARVDDGDHERYGLDGGEEILVEVEAGDTSLARFFVGANAGGGSTFVRLPDSGVVYLARIGGRSRFEGSPASWRDRLVLDLDPARIVGLRIDAPDGSALDFGRDLSLGPDGTPRAGPWHLAGEAAFPVDQLLLDRIAEALGTLRAEEVLPADHPGASGDPTVRVHLRTDAGEDLGLDLSLRAGAAFARPESGDALYRVGADLVGALAADPSQWRDRTLLDLDPARIVALRLEGPGGTASVERDPRALWRMVEPPNVDLDPRRVEEVVQAVARLRAANLVELDPRAAGLPGAERLVLIEVDGARTTLELGDPVPGTREGQEARYARIDKDPDRVGILSAVAWSRVRRAFGR